MGGGAEGLRCFPFGLLIGFLSIFFSGCEDILPPSLRGAIIAVYTGVVLMDFPPQVNISSTTFIYLGSASLYRYTYKASAQIAPFGQFFSWEQPPPPPPRLC